MFTEDKAESKYTQLKVRPGARVEHLHLSPSSDNTTGFDCPFIKNLKLTEAEYNKLGIIPVGEHLPLIDIILLDYPSDNPESNDNLWEALISGDSPEISEEMLSNIKEALIPQFSTSELAASGITENSKTTHDIRKNPYSHFLNATLKDARNGKKLLLVIGHGDDTDTGAARQIGSHSYTRASDTPEHLYANLPLSDYSAVLDATCANKSWRPNAENLPQSETPIFMAQNPVVFIGHPNEQQSGCFVWKDGSLKSYNWQSVLQQRRQEGKLV